MFFGSTIPVGLKTVYSVGLSRLTKLKALKIRLNDHRMF